MFDSCLLLSSNGHVVYSGPQNMAMHYMAFIGFYKPVEENTADFLMDVIAGTSNMRYNTQLAVTGCSHSTRPFV